MNPIFSAPFGNNLNTKFAWREVFEAPVTPYNVSSPGYGYFNSFNASSEDIANIIWQLFNCYYCQHLLLLILVCLFWHIWSIADYLFFLKYILWMHISVMVVLPVRQFMLWAPYRYGSFSYAYIYLTMILHLHIWIFHICDIIWYELVSAMSMKNQ